MSEELWQRSGESSYVALAPWPEVDPELLEADTVTMAVQINGKTKGTIQVTGSTSQEAAIELAKELKSVQVALENQALVRTIYKPGKILNLIVK